MSKISRRGWLAGAVGTGILGVHTMLHAQAPAAAPADLDADGAAALRVSQDLAMLLQVQLMIGTSVDYEYLRMFDSFTDLNIRVSASPAAYQNLMPDPAASPTAGRGGFRRRPTDVIVLFDQIYDMPQSSEDSLRRYVEAGKGIVVLHNALTDFQRWPFWYRDVVGGAYTIPDVIMPKEFAGAREHGPIDDVVVSTPSSSPDRPIAPGVWNFHEYTIVPVGNHPVLEGVTSFTVRDEKYKSIWYSDKITPILETSDPASDKIIGWIGPNSQAKVFALILGHSADAHAHPMYRRIVHNAILWAGGRLS